MEMTEAKRRILEVSLDLFSVYGYEGTSVGMIADAVGIRKPSLYSHFKSKQEIFETILLEEAEYYDRFSLFTNVKWTDAGQKGAASVPFCTEDIVKNIEKQFQLLIHDPGVCRVRRILTIEQFRDPEIAATQEKRSYGNIRAYHEDMMRSLMKNGALRNGDAREYAVLFFAPISLELYRVDRDPSVEEEAMENVRRHIRQFFELYGKTAKEIETAKDSKTGKAVITTGRLILRELEGTDLEALYRVLGDSDIMRHYPYTFDETRVRHWIEKNRERYAELGFGLWAVCLKETGELIGDCGLTIQNIDGKLCPEIGYHIRKDMQQKGYAREAAAAVRDWAFANTPFGTLYSYMESDNIASAKTAESYGAEKCGEYTDEEGLHFVYRLDR